MPFETVCSSCSTKINVEDELIGKAIKCPKCGERITVSANGSMVANASRPDDPLGTTDHKPSAATPGPDVTRSFGEDLPPADGGTAAFLPGQDTEPTDTAPARGLPAIPGYRVLREIARGGMGKVLAAFDLNLDREVALKILLPGANADRFVRESKITARLPHPGIPPVYALGTLADGSPFLAMKLIAGQTLAAEMKAADRPRLLQVLTQVCQAVGFAHSRSIIHRDLKPANVMVGAFGEVQVMDWGLAKDLSGLEVAAPGSSAVPTVPVTDANQTTDHRVPAPGESTDDQTQAGQVMGTPAYMAPEQARGAAVNARADVFALGGILCAILTGKPPFGGESALEVIKRAAAADLAEASARLDGCGADAELVGLCRRCLIPNPMNRPADGRAVADGLNAYLNGVQERLQAAERERAVTVARETEQRKRRRVQFALAGLSFLVVLGLVVGGFEYQAQLQEARERAKADARAAELVKSLSSSDTAFVPLIVQELANYRSQAEPALADMLANAKPASKERLHASLALLPSDPTQVEYLRHRILTARPAEIVVIRQALTKHAAEVSPQLWTIAEDQAGAMDQRLHALAALAGLDPGSERWQPLAAPLAQNLVAESPVLIGPWLEIFRPARRHLLEPLSTLFRKPVGEGGQTDLKSSLAEFQQRSVAVSLLADYASDHPELLAELLMDADARQYAVLWPPFAKVSDQGVASFLGELAKKLPAELPFSHKDREILAKRQANAAVALLRLGKPEQAWKFLKHSSDPRVRSYLIHYLGPKGVNAQTLIVRLHNETDLTVQRALLLSLGEFTERDFGPGEREALLPRLQEIYQRASDPGLHAACEWLLRGWKQEAWLRKMNEAWAKDKEQREKRLQGIGKALAKDKDKTPPQWYINTQGQTMVVIPGPVEFVMGSPSTEPGRDGLEIEHKTRIGRTFVLSAKPVTLGEYRTFEPSYRNGSEIARWARSDDCPVLGTNWFQAVQYCNWLSKREGLPDSECCYEPVLDPEAWPLFAVSSVGLLHSSGGQGPFPALGGMYPGRLDAQYKGGMRLARNYLQRQGYRLPTEAEMEYATRAGAVTSRYYGETDELLPKYAWYKKNAQDKTWPVGSLKPNDLGLFDAQGNVFTWCQERFKAYPDGNKVTDDTEDDLLVTNTDSRALRGGAFSDLASYVRSANRTYNVPTFWYSIFGFRLARTFVR